MNFNDHNSGLSELVNLLEVDRSSIVVPESGKEGRITNDKHNSSYTNDNNNDQMTNDLDYEFVTMRTVRVQTNNKITGWKENDPTNVNCSSQTTDSLVMNNEHNEMSANKQGEFQENGLPPFHSVVIDSEPPPKRTKLQEESPARESMFQEMVASTSGNEVNQTGAFEQTDEQTSKSTPIPSIFVVEETPGPSNTGEHSGTQENMQTESSCLSSSVDHNSQLSALMLMFDSPDSSQQNNNTIVRQVIIDEVEDDFSPNVLPFRRSSSLPIVMPSTKRLKTKHQCPTLEELWQGAENDIPPNCVLHDQIYGNDALEYENDVNEVRIETNTIDMKHNSQPIIEEDKQASFSAEVQEHSQDFGPAHILSNNSNESENLNENSILLNPSTSADNNEENVNDNFLINQSINKTDEHNGEGRENIVEEQSLNNNESPRNIAQILLQLKLSPHLKQFCKEALIQY